MRRVPKSRATDRSRFDPRTVAPQTHKGQTGLHLDWVTCAQRLGGDACDELIAVGRSYPHDRPTVVGQDVLHNHRVGIVHMLPRNSRTLAVYELLWRVAEDATKFHYRLSIRGISRMPHYVEYHGGRGHFDWHNDYSHESDEAPRKLTVIIQLSAPEDYEGGNLEVFGAIPTILPRLRGTIICLPSFVPHRVTAVTAGVRRIIVAWIAGPRLV